jgi:hypothetical protein
MSKGKISAADWTWTSTSGCLGFPNRMMKKCPYCAEEIQDEAIKCRHCMEFLDGAERQLAVAAALGNGIPWYCKTSFIILTFVMVPPLALPLVWLHPKLHLAWKLVITIAIGLICWGMYVTFLAFVRQFEEATKMLEGMQI